MTGQQLALDEDVQAVLEFMQRKIATCKLMQVAEAVAEIGAILWKRYNAEEFTPLALICSDQVGALQPIASESAPVRTGAGGGSAGGAVCL